MTMLKGFMAGLVMTVALSSSAFALTSAEAKVQAEALAEFLHIGRVTVASALAKYKINDASIGDKGFKPEVFKEEINKGFKESTGIDIIAGMGGEKLPAGTMDLLKIILEASKQVAADNQEIINAEGLGFKGFIPASYGRQVGDIFLAKTGIQLKQTTDKLRNEYNKPDAFEAAVIQKMLAPGWPKGQNEFKEEGDSYRLARPIYIKKGCLGCHGDPKGELDVAGRKKEGYKVGDLRGIISVKIPVK